MTSQPYLSPTTHCLQNLDVGGNWKYYNSWMLPRKHQAGRGCAGRYPYTLIAYPLHFQITENTGQVPPWWQWWYLRGLLTETPSTAERIFTASKFSSSEVTKLCPTHFSYAKSSFPSLQIVVFSASCSASMQEWNNFWMEEVDLWKVFLLKKKKKSNSIKKTNDGCVAKDIPKLSIFWPLLAASLAAKQQKQTLPPG